MTTNIPRFTMVCQAFSADYGFSPFGIFCLMTGKCIGHTTQEELGALVDSIPGDADDVVDDIAIRIFASMRPSLRWNKLRPESLEQMRTREPVDTLAYLLNRLFTPLDKKGDLLAIHHDRIRTYQWCERMGVNDSTNTLMYLLLEVDAKLGLNTEWPTFSIEDVLGTDLESMPVLLEMVSAWHARRVSAYDEKVRHMEASERWWRSGSALARPAFFSAFMESKPLSKTAAKEAEKTAERRFWLGLLGEVLGESTDAEKAAVKPNPTLLPVTKMPARFGVKKAEG